MKLSDLRIATRLYLGFGAMVALLVILVFVAYTNFARLRSANDLNIHTYQVMTEVDSILENLLNIETGERGFAITGEEMSLAPYKEGKEAFNVHFENAKKLTADNPAQQERLQRLAQAQQQWLEGAIDLVIKIRRDVVDGKASMDSVAAYEQSGKGKRGMDAMRGILKEMLDAEKSLLAVRAKEADSLASLTASTLIGGGVMAAVLAAILALWLARNITRPLREAVDVAEQVAQGDLTVKVHVKSKDETGQLMRALKDMNEALVRIVGEVRTGTDTIATASTQITSGNLDLSSRTEQQASSLEETASSMEELTGTVKQNADNARQACTLATTASDVAMKGGAVVSEVVETMGAINDSAKKIVDIIGVIDGIAFQTNILALNAAVEAARAGEQGRGFAVVAAEVRNLAQRSAGAAKEIKSLIGDSVEKVDAGAKLVDQAGATMDEVVNSVKRVTDIISEIAAASDEQRAGIEQVNQAITQMDQVTQQNAALVEEAAAAAEALQDQASKLSQVVSVFRLEAGAVAAPRIATLQPQAAPKLAAARSATPARLASAAAGKSPRPLAGVGSSLPATAGGNEDWEEF